MTKPAWQEVPLFDLGPATPPAPLESSDRRRTRRNNDLIARGTHPATRLPINPGLGNCGTCAHAHTVSSANRSGWKCDQPRLGMSNSAASDIRLKWPACELHTKRWAKPDRLPETR